MEVTIVETNGTQTALIAATDDKIKVQLYFDVVELLVKAMSGKNDQKFIRNLGPIMTNLNMRLIVCASDDVAKAYFKWRAIAGLGTDPAASVDTFIGMLMAMRKDLNPATALALEDVEGVFQ